MKIQKYKKELDYSYASGIFPTVELLLNRPESVLEIILNSKANDNEGILKIKDICRKKGILLRVDDSSIGLISSKENCYAAGVFKKYTTGLKAKKDHIVLVNPENAGNLGTIVRTMAGFKVTELALLRPAVDIFDPSVIRASMGSIFKCNFSYFENFKEYSGEFKDREWYPFLTNGKNKLNELEPASFGSYIFGGESSGLPEEFLHIGKSVVIPQSKEIDSLNLSIAVGIALYQIFGGKKQ